MQKIKQTSTYKHNKKSVANSNATAYNQPDKKEFRKTINLLSKR